MHTLFKVVTKAAIFNSDKSKVLVIHMDRINDYGLPGGHIEKDESIEDAMKRELYEECGVETATLKKCDFFFHSNGKVVLAFTGNVSTDKILSKQNNLEGIPKWLTREEFEHIKIEPSYRKLVLDNWE